MIKSYFDSKEGMTDRQKGFINKHRTPKKKGVYTVTAKKKYWCPVFKENYTATDRRVHCPYCYNPNGRYDDRHDPILFDPKIHKF